MWVNERRCRALVDSGCTDTLIYEGCCDRWVPRSVAMTTVNGGTLRCSGVADVAIECQGKRVMLAALVVPNRPLGMDLVLGMSGITALGGVSLRTPADVSFRAAAAVTAEQQEVTADAPKLTARSGSDSDGMPAQEGVSSQTPTDGSFLAAATEPSELQPVTVEGPDYTAEFSPGSGVWTVAWKWTGGTGPECLSNTVAEYAVPEAARPEFDAEIDEWIANGWLQPYDEKTDGPPRGLLPLMAVEQPNKVRPVLDYRELNGHVTAHTAGADVCADQLRKWRRHGSRIAVVDLRKAYLQLRLDRRLWPYQTVRVRGQRFCLRRLGFGLNVAPTVMKAVVGAVLQRDKRMQQGVLPYVDDLLVDEDIVSAEEVIQHFARYGLDCKPPQRAADGARLLGLRVGTCGGELRWQRDSEIPAPPTKITRRALFAWCGRLVAHLPVAGWLRPAAAWLKRRVNSLTRGWDDVTDDQELQGQIRYVVQQLQAADPARGPWRLTGDRLIAWTDASSVANGVVLEDPGRGTVEDASWLRAESKADMHINMAELDAALRGINMAVAWGVKVIDLRTDSATVHRWIDDALSGRARLRTKAHGELLIRRRIEMIKQLVEELQLSVTVGLVRSSQNPADALTRVPKTWMCAAKAPAARVTAAAGRESRDDGESCVSATGVDVARARKIHETTGHQGIRRTLWYVRREMGPMVRRSVVRDIIRQCDVCQSIDPAPVRWQPGSLGVRLAWERLAMDVVKYNGRMYLSVIDCGPSRYCLWRALRRSDASEITQRLEEIFLERGAPAELLTDNAREFRGRQLADLMTRWGVTLRFRAAHEPSGNGIIERNHRTIKTMAARQNITVGEAVHRYNMTPRDGQHAETAPAAGVLVRPGRDLPPMEGLSVGPPPPPNPEGRHPNFRVGDLVWVRCRGSPTRCTDVSRRGVVTKIVSSQQVEVDGVPRHVRSVRRRQGGAPPSPPVSDTDDSDVGWESFAEPSTEPSTLVSNINTGTPVPDVDTTSARDVRSVTPLGGRGSQSVALTDLSEAPPGITAADVRDDGCSTVRRGTRTRQPTNRLYAGVPDELLDEVFEVFD